MEDGGQIYHDKHNTTKGDRTYLFLDCFLVSSSRLSSSSSQLSVSPSRMGGMETLR